MDGLGRQDHGEDRTGAAQDGTAQARIQPASNKKDETINVKLFTVHYTRFTAVTVNGQVFHYRIVTMWPFFLAAERSEVPTPANVGVAVKSAGYFFCRNRSASIPACLRMARSVPSRHVVHGDAQETFRDRVGGL